MSTHIHKDTFQSFVRPDGAFGPTNTQTAQKRFAQRLRGVLSRINAAIRRGIVKDDVFNLQEQSDTLAVDDPGPFDADNSPQKTAQFLSWLREQLDTEFLTVVGPDRNQFLRKAYAEGIRNVNRQLRDLDVSFETADMEDMLSRPINRQALQDLFSRTYSNLQSVSDDIVDDVRDTLLEGFQDGQAPSKIAKNLTNRVDSIGKHRSTMIARSEVINAHSSGSLNRIDEANEAAEVDIAAGHGVWDAADDNRVCAFCEALDGTPMSTDEMRNTQANVVEEIGENFLGNTFRLKPPAHPHGRCNIRVMIGADVSGDLDSRLPDAISV